MTVPTRPVKKGSTVVKKTVYYNTKNCPDPLCQLSYIVQPLNKILIAIYINKNLTKWIVDWLFLSILRVNNSSDQSVTCLSLIQRTHCQRCNKWTVRDYLKQIENNYIRKTTRNNFIGPATVDFTQLFSHFFRSNKRIL